jgi:7-cyano-7-deazaguanine synthase
MKSNELAIVLVSGGMDSLVVAALACQEHEHVGFLHLNYGQKTAQKEFECFNKIADHYQIPNQLRKVIDMSFLSQIGGSSLTDTAIAVTDYKGDDDKEIPNSYVPFRNTHIIAMAVSWAEILGAKKIYIGANYEDSPGYPDCRPEYYQAYNELIKKGTKNQGITILTPIIMLKKKEIVEKAVQYQAPLEYTWSCYAKSDVPCGKCDSCALRIRGFKEAGQIDPIY